MAEVKIKFSLPGIRQIFSGQKTMTTRDEAKGKSGDTFTLTHPDTNEVKTFRIKWVSKWSLGWIAKNKFKEEGFSSPETYRAAMDFFYSPMKSNKMMYLHEFEEA